MDFKNKTVVITGASRGIGRATAIAFAREGAKVVVNYLKEKESADKVVAEIKKIGADAVAIQADVSKEEDVRGMIEQAVRRFGGVDVLVNNAGIVFDVPILEK